MGHKPVPTETRRRRPLTSPWPDSSRTRGCALSYVVHVGAAVTWLWAVAFVVYADLPAALAGETGRASFERTLDRLLRVTRWTGVVLPLSGLYQVWLFYPLDRLLGTPRGWLVLSMAALWTAMNGLIEVGAYRARTLGGPVSAGRYLAAGYLVDGGAGDVPVTDLAATARPYLLVAVGLGALLVVDAGLLAA